jgi:hypothetical protein
MFQYQKLEQEIKCGGYVSTNELWKTSKRDVNLIKITRKYVFKHVPYNSKVLCLVGGEGTHPTIGYVLSCLYPEWNVISADPNMNEHWSGIVPNLTCFRTKIESSLNNHTYDVVIIVSPLGHFNMNKLFKKVIKTYKCHVIACSIPCNHSYQYVHRTPVKEHKKHSVFIWDSTK